MGNSDKKPANVPAGWPIFRLEYLSNGFNASAAYEVAYPMANKKTAASNSWKLLQSERMQAYLADGVAELFGKLELKAEDVLRLIWDTATADPNELIEVRRVCCRHCYGRDHRYQMTPSEWEEVVKAFQQAVDKWEREGCKTDPPVLDDQGGIDFNRTLPPVADCPECHGEGWPDILVKDTRYLSPAAKRLYAGAKRTRGGGLEILTHSRDKNLELLGKYLGLFKDTIDHRSSDGSMSPHPPMTLAEFYGEAPDTESESS